MAYEKKDNEIVIFANDNRRNDRDPNGKGSGMVNGIEYWVASWNNVSKDGKQYRTVKLTPKQEQSVQQPVAAHAAADEDVPF